MILTQGSDIPARSCPPVRCPIMHPQTELPAEPVPAPPHRPKKRLLFLLSIIVVPLVLVAAGLFVYLDEGAKFSAAPPACATVEQSLHLLGFAYIPHQDKASKCDLRAPKDHAFQAQLGDTPVITVAFGLMEREE